MPNPVQPPTLGRPTPPQGLWRRTPPAIFPPVMGLFGLGLAWRRGAEVIGLPAGIGEAILGGTTLLFLFCLVAWAAKPLRRPAVIREELAILPGRAGVTAASLCVTLMAAAVVPYAPGLAFALAVAGLAVHLALVALMLRSFAASPPEGRVVTPVWHLLFVGFILGPLAWVPLGAVAMAQGVLVVTVPAALAIWAVSLVQLVRRIPPAPLRPLLAIHLAPASLFATVLALLDMPRAAAAMAVLALAILLALLVAGRWLTEAGFSALWGAFTFPLAACAAAVLAQGWAVVGVVLLVAATAAVMPIAFRVLREWARGGLAARTNAATA